MTRLILIRHCEAEGNHKRIFQGHTDADVSENGRTQLELLSLRCRNMPIDIMYSSPLKRAYATAQAVNRFHNLPISIEPGLIEINGGDWEGKPWSSLPDLYPEAAKAWNMAPWDFIPPNGEAMRDVYSRIWDTISRLIKENPDKTVAVASHGCAIRNFLCHVLHHSILRLNEVDWCDNTALNIIDFDSQMNPTVILLNDASHLTEETSTFSKQSWWRPENRGSDRFD
jgi:broad specificity phosphatase PhoE